MKNSIILFAACLMSVQSSFAQQPDHIDGGTFEKKIEYNAFRGVDAYDLSSKSRLDRILFGWTNSFVEYIFSPSFQEVLALRVVKDSLTYKLELFRLDYPKIWSEIYAYERRYPDAIPADSLMTFSDCYKLITKHNNYIRSHSYYVELHKKYGPKPKSFEISEQFAAKLHDRIKTLIRDFKAVGKNQLIVDGETATFRCVVGDELWSLQVHIPQQRVLGMSDLFNQMIIEADEGSKSIDEAKYSKLLDEIGM